MMLKAIVRSPPKTGEKLAAEPSTSMKLVLNQKAPAAVVVAGAVALAAAGEAAEAVATAVAVVVAAGAATKHSDSRGPGAITWRWGRGLCRRPTALKFSHCY